MEVGNFFLIGRKALVDCECSLRIAMVNRIFSGKQHCSPRRDNTIFRTCDILAVILRQKHVKIGVIPYFSLRQPCSVEMWVRIPFFGDRNILSIDEESLYYQYGAGHAILSANSLREGPKNERQTGTEQKPRADAEGRGHHGRDDAGAGEDRRGSRCVRGENQSCQFSQYEYNKFL